MKIKTKKCFWIQLSLLFKYNNYIRRRGIYTTSKTIIDIIGNLGIFDLRNPVRRRCIDLAVLEIWRVGGRGHDPKPCHSFSAGCEFFLHRIQQCLRKQLTFYDPTTGFPVKWLLSKDFRNSILMMHHYPDLDSTSDWLKQISLVVQSISNTTQIEYCHVISVE